MRRFLVIALILLLFPAIAIFTRPVAGAPVVALPDCVGVPEVRPAQVTFSCADANLYVDKITWSHWGEQFATGIGTLTENDCKPYCAAGHFHSSPAMVIVAGQQTCPNGQLAYNNVAYERLVNGVPKIGKTTDWYYFACMKK
jgi:hypothetical protein